MKRAELKNAATIRSYLDQFERRFVQTDEGVVYLPGETGHGVRLPSGEAAAIIAGMRATMAEADARQLLWGQDAFFAAGFALCVTIMLGAVTGYQRIATAALMPIGLGIIVLGPLLGSLRVNLAWRRALKETARRMERFERLDLSATRRMVRPNAVKPVFVVAATLAVAVIAGLMFAAATAPSYGAAAIDRFAAGIVWPAAMVLIVLAFVYKAVDAHVRPRVSEAEVRIAARRQEHRPLSPTDAAWHEAALADSRAPEPEPARTGFGRRTPSPYGRRTPR
ncbi:hypothetical protein [Sphingomonas aracearum]|uniref:Uncharacterized protein n=1 Tax=Sphingomonas aracearum TaxID=2283317 RepID=A0A369VVZ8_9SPHN|nr:hypothetical protein [Sphingomonas aracearum]RDE05242.1 hypothetical protein DVW87_08190 [Sphingomonas aracearum]